MPRHVPTIALAVTFAFAAFLGPLAHADLSINDIQPTAPAHAPTVHHPRFHPHPRHKPTVAAPTAPTSLTVSQAAGSKYPTINSALAVIATGGTITVEPGDYVESIALTRPVTIVANPAAPVGSVIVESATRPPLAMLTSTGTIRGIRFRMSTVVPATATVTVDISQGSLLMEGCHIDSASNAAVSIHGAAATPTLRRCVIPGGGIDSVAITDGARPVIDSCTIYGPNRSAVMLDCQAAPTIVDCRISASRGWDGVSSGPQTFAHGVGIYIAGPAGGTVTGCDIGPTGNSGIGGIAGTTKIAGCTIHDTDRDGITLDVASSSPITNCEIERAHYTGITLSHMTTRITGCKIHNCGHGIYLANSAATIKHCSISDGATEGIDIDPQSTGTIEDCTISNNNFSGVLVYGHGIIKGGTIHDIKSYGIVCKRGSFGTISGVTIARCNDSGIMAEAGVTLTVDNVDVSKCGHAAIECTGATVNVADSKVHDQADYGVVFYGGAVSMASTNIGPTGNSSLYFGGNGFGVVSDCNLHDSAAYGVEIYCDSLDMHKCTVSNIAREGIAAHAGVSRIFSDTTITHANTGVRLYGNASTTLVRCSFTDISDWGLDRFGGDAVITDCTYVRNGRGTVGPLSSVSERPANVVTRVNAIDGSTMVYVSAGSFEMGSTYKTEWGPVHTVILDGFWIDKNDVTVAQYRTFCRATGRAMPVPPSWGWHDDHPIVNVKWSDAAAYAKWARMALPTEAQWEKAARGTDRRDYPWGNAWDNEASSNATNQSTTRSVGQFEKGASPYGALDMFGNAQNWCADWYDPAYYVSSPSNNPAGPAIGDRRVVRGAWWDWYSPDYRTSSRGGLEPDNAKSTIGFRCVSLPQ